MATGGITFNGSSQYLELSDKIVSAYPVTLVAWVASDGSGSGQAAVICQGSTTHDAFQWGGYGRGSNDKYASDRAAGNSYSATKATTPNMASGSLTLLMVVFESTQQTVYFGSSTGTTSSASPGQTYSDLNRFLVGAWRRSAGVDSYANATIAEAHVFNTALSSSDFTTLLTTPAEDVTGWVDGWMLATNSDLTSIGGTRTLTAVGSPTTGSLTLPYTRTPSSNVAAISNYYSMMRAA